MWESDYCGLMFDGSGYLWSSPPDMPVFFVAVLLSLIVMLLLEVLMH